MRALVVDPSAPEAVHLTELAELAPGGTLHSIGWTSGEPAVFPPYSTVGPPKSLRSFLNAAPFGADLADLVRLVESGAVPVRIGWRGPLEGFAEAAQALRDRKIDGKAILDARATSS